MDPCSHHIGSTIEVAGGMGMSGRRDGIGNGFCVISAVGWNWALIFEAHNLFGHGVGLVYALHRRGSCRCGCGEMDVIGT